MINKAILGLLVLNRGMNSYDNLGTQNWKQSQADPFLAKNGSWYAPAYDSYCASCVSCSWLHWFRRCNKWDYAEISVIEASAATPEVNATERQQNSHQQDAHHAGGKYRNG